MALTHTKVMAFVISFCLHFDDENEETQSKQGEISFMWVWKKTFDFRSNELSHGQMNKHGG